MWHIQHWKEEQWNIDDYNLLNNKNGRNCVRAYRYPETTYDYKTSLILDSLKQIQFIEYLGNTFLKSKVNYVMIMNFQFK